MKIGVKTFNNPQFVDNFENKVDFFEIMAVRGNDYSFLKKYQIPIIIHAEHGTLGSNPADKKRLNTNLESIKFAIKIADSAESKKIIFHTGNMFNEDCSKEQSIKFIKDLNDKRIILENLTPKEKNLCTNPEETEEFLKKTNSGFCFDINHAIESAVFFKQNYISFLKSFLALKPQHYHFGGQVIKENKTHLPLKSCDFNIQEVINLLPEEAEITLETTTDISDTKEDINIIKKIINKQ